MLKTLPYVFSVRQILTKIFTHMNAVAIEKKEDIIEENLGELRSITISLSSTDKKGINRAAKEFYDFVKTMDESAEEPTILPVEEACFTTRKSPCGNGTATFSRVKLRVYQRIFNLSVHDKEISRIVEFLKSSSADAQLKMNF